MSWPNCPVEIERNHETLSQQIPGSDWKMSGTARHDWLCYLYISFFLILFCTLCVSAVRRWRFEISGHSARMYTDQVTSYVEQWHWSVAPSGGFVLSKPTAAVMSMQEIQAMPRLPGFVTYICTDTYRILVAESKLLRIKIKQLYCREPLLVTRFNAL